MNREPVEMLGRYFVGRLDVEWSGRQHETSIPCAFKRASCRPAKLARPAHDAAAQDRINSAEALPFRQWCYFIRRRCPCVLPVQFRKSAGAFARARSGEG